MNKEEVETILEQAGFVKNTAHLFKYTKTKGRYLVGVSYTFHDVKLSILEKDVHAKPDPRDENLHFTPARISGLSVSALLKKRYRPEATQDIFQITVWKYDIDGKSHSNIYNVGGTDFTTFEARLEEAMSKIGK